MITWIKRNWSLLLLIIIVLAWLLKSFFGIGVSNLASRSGSNIAFDSSYGGTKSVSSLALPAYQYRPSEAVPVESSSRLLIQETSLSLQVLKVEETIKKVQSIAESMGGYLVNSTLSKPEGAASGTIVIRLPSDKRTQALEQLRTSAVKVVSESVQGQDVTDEYADLEAQLAVLNTTKAKFEEILAKATQVNDLLNVNQQLINIQSQIDKVKGRQQYYEQTAKLTKITVYLSTDDLSLPYTPDDAWRPAVVFKQAVRSMLSTLRGLGCFVLWLVAYLPIILPVVAGIWLFRRLKNKKLIV